MTYKAWQLANLDRQCVEARSQRWLRMAGQTTDASAGTERPDASADARKTGVGVDSGNKRATGRLERSQGGLFGRAAEETAR